MNIYNVYIHNTKLEFACTYTFAFDLEVIS